MITSSYSFVVEIVRLVAIYADEPSLSAKIHGTRNDTEKLIERKKLLYFTNIESVTA